LPNGSALLNIQSCGNNFFSDTHYLARLIAAAAADDDDDDEGNLATKQTRENYVNIFNRQQQLKYLHNLPLICQKFLSSACVEVGAK
jgi:hypothetical protein